MRRIDKTIAYIANPTHLEHFDICIRPTESTKTNCGTCAKCGRFLLVAEFQGAIDKFAAVFDLDAFRSGRDEVIAQMTARAYRRFGNTNDRDHLYYLREHGADLSSAALARGYLSTVRGVPTISAAGRTIRRRVNGLRS